MSLPCEIAFVMVFNDGNAPSFDWQSAADRILCRVLMQRTDDEDDQADHPLRRSRLYRSKWDEQRGTTIYGAIIIAKAFNSSAKPKHA